MQIIRCLINQDFNEIKTGTCTKPNIPVYYGYNTYRNDMEYMNWIVDAIKFEHPGIELKDMHVYHHSVYHSAHYNHTFVSILLPTEQVKAQMDRYTKLS